MFVHETFQQFFFSEPEGQVVAKIGVFQNNDFLFLLLFSFPLLIDFLFSHIETSLSSVF